MEIAALPEMKIASREQFQIMLSTLAADVLEVTGLETAEARQAIADRWQEMMSAVQLFIQAADGLLGTDIGSIEFIVEEDRQPGYADQIARSLCELGLISETSLDDPKKSSRPILRAWQRPNTAQLYTATRVRR